MPGLAQSLGNLFAMQTISTRLKEYGEPMEDDIKASGISCLHVHVCDDDGSNKGRSKLCDTTVGITSVCSRSMAG